MFLRKAVQVFSLLIMLSFTLHSPVVSGEEIRNTRDRYVVRAQLFCARLLGEHFSSFRRQTFLSERLNDQQRARLLSEVSLYTRYQILDDLIRDILQGGQISPNDLTPRIHWVGFILKTIPQMLASTVAEENLFMEGLIFLSKMSAPAIELRSPLGIRVLNHIEEGNVSIEDRLAALEQLADIFISGNLKLEQIQLLVRVFQKVTKELPQTAEFLPSVMESFSLLTTPRYEHLPLELKRSVRKTLTNLSSELFAPEAIREQAAEIAQRISVLR